MKYYMGHKFWKTHIYHEFRQRAFKHGYYTISKALYAINGPIVIKQAEEQPYLTSAIQTQSYINKKLAHYHFGNKNIYFKKYLAS